MIKKIFLSLMACGVLFAQAQLNNAMPQLNQGVVTVTVSKAFNDSVTVSSLRLSTIGEGYFPYRTWIPENLRSFVKLGNSLGVISTGAGVIGPGQTQDIYVTIDLTKLIVGFYQIPITFIGEAGNTYSITGRIDLIVTDTLGDPNRPPQPTDRFVPHIAAGGNWKTTLRMVNPTSEDIKATVQLLSSEGRKKSFRVNGGHTSEFPTVILPNSFVEYEFTGFSTLETGSAIVRTISGGTPVVSAIYRTLDLPRQSAVEIKATRSNHVVYYDNRGRKATGLAIGNHYNSATYCVLEFYDSFGTLTTFMPLMLNPLASEVFSIPERFQVLNGTHGTIRIVSDHGSLSVFGLHFDHEGETFSTEPGN